MTFQKNENDANVPLSRAPRLVDENNPGTADSSGEQVFKRQNELSPNVQLVLLQISVSQIDTAKASLSIYRSLLYELMQEEAANERLDARGGEESSGVGEVGAVGNTEDLNSEQFEEEEEFVEEERGGHPQSLLSELYKENPGSGVPGPRQLRCKATNQKSISVKEKFEHIEALLPNAVVFVLQFNFCP